MPARDLPGGRAAGAASVDQHHVAVCKSPERAGVVKAWAQWAGLGRYCGQPKKA